MTRHAALLFTDIVDSTRRTQLLGDAAMAEVWTRHDRLARDLLAQFGGTEIDRTDGFLLLFGTVPAAVGYALGYHRALESLDLAARVGVHAGPVALGENTPADVARGAKRFWIDGTTKSVASAVMALAAGRQTFLTEAARGALGDSPWSEHFHGTWRVKGVAEPLGVFEVGATRAPFTPPTEGSQAYQVVRDGPRWVPTRTSPTTCPRSTTPSWGAPRISSASARASRKGLGW